MKVLSLNVSAALKIILYTDMQVLASMFSFQYICVPVKPSSYFCFGPNSPRKKKGTLIKVIEPSPTMQSVPKALCFA